MNITAFAVKPVNLAGLIALVDTGKINNSVASQKLFPALIDNPEKSPAELAKDLNLLISAGTDDVAPVYK